LIRYGMNVSRGIDAQAEVMQTWGVRVVFRGPTGRPQHKAEVTVEVLNVRVARKSEFILAESENLHHHAVIELL
jgi:hypothetical protein